MNIKLGITGYPLERSLSPLIFGVLSRELKLPLSYEKIEIGENEIPELSGRLKKGGYDGVNITSPFKERVIPLLDGVSEEARLIGAVNTVKAEKGGLYGFNTDVRGFLKSIADIDLKGYTALVVGAGGAARAAVYGFLKSGCSRIGIINRTAERAGRLVGDFGKLDDRVRIEYFAFDGKIPLVRDEKIDMIVNATPAGIFPSVQSLPLGDRPDLKESTLVYDMVYSPSDTPFVKWARRRNLPARNGLDMLIHQALESWKIWLPAHPLPETAFGKIRRALNEELQ